ncbi:MAG: NADP-dependent malic enzyme [Acidobacteria bacterium]|nr:NADP-dependent malic enzyme [Acidobacteriota bacterium]MCB9397471.1 NADP-dependent malic enzyme [Acidobacteriota bacterium]
MKKKALDYHELGRPGKIEVIPSKPCDTAKDLALAYTPGVAVPCLEIEQDPANAYRFTNKGNLVAVISNGTAVLGLGSIGALAGKPVMEGKGVLFKKFADIDVFDIEIDERDPDKLVEIVKSLEPTFGGINLEDIKGPECFYIEKRLREEMKIPVFHDDQHGTAIIVAAAMLNALELADKKMEDIRLVVSGAGAAAVACTELLFAFGLRREHVILCDSKGPLHRGRTDIRDETKKRFMVDRPYENLAEALIGADAFLGLSVKGVVTPDMLRTMADNPIVLALANPDPEIAYPDAMEARTDIIMATGRSDYPNQVNNVLGFPYIFRGALDVRATRINEDMKQAAARALAILAKEPVPESVAKAYSNQHFEFGRLYFIPKPLDPRVLLRVAPAVAQAAIDSGEARVEHFDMDIYMARLSKLQDQSKVALEQIFLDAKANPKRIAFTNGDLPKVGQIVKRVLEEGIAKPVLLGDRTQIEENLKKFRVDPNRVEMVDPLQDEAADPYTQQLYAKRQRKGLTLPDAQQLMKRDDVFAALMLQNGRVDGMINGFSTTYPKAVRTLLQVLRKDKGNDLVVGLYIMAIKQRLLFFADTTMTEEPTAEQLAQIAIKTADYAANFTQPRVAMLSYSNFGSAPSALTQKVVKATSLVRQLRPDLEVDGELQPDMALDMEVRQHQYPFSTLSGPANVLIFPDLTSGNLAHKLLLQLAQAKFVGPILVDLGLPANAVQRHATVEEVVSLTAITCVEAQWRAAKS